MSSKALLVAACMAMQVAPAWAGALLPKKASDVVALVNSGACSGLGGVSAVLGSQVTPDGTTTPFSIPTGQVLVVTAVTVIGIGGVANTKAQVRLWLGGSLETFAVQELLRGADGRYDARFDFPNGVVVRSGGLCVNDLSSTLFVAYAYGFLAKDK